MFCDIHQEEPSLFYLETTEGDCYYFCMLVELKALLDWVPENGELPPCGHGMGPEPMWFTLLPKSKLDELEMMVN